MRYLIYCDESDDKGSYYSNFYGGALLKLSDQAAIEARLKAAKGNHPTTGEVYADKEFKWTKVCPYMEANYMAFVQETFALVREGLLKIRIMFTQNINDTDKLGHDADNGFFILYYQFLKHAFSIFKRGMVGTYQHCGEQHLHRYLAEFDFRYSNRSALEIDDVQRAKTALKGIQGKRLTYRRTGEARHA